MTASPLAGGEIDISITVTVPSGQNDFSIGVAWRRDGTSDPAAVPGSRLFPLNGQSCRLDTNGNLYLYRHNSGSLTALNASPANVGPLVGRGSRNLRIQQVGTALRVKVWNGGTAEPAVWALDLTDAGAWTTGGRISLGVAAGFNGAIAASQTAVFDNLIVSGAPADPPPPVIDGRRRNWALMSSADQQAVIDGLQRAKASGTYDNLTRLHQQAMLDSAANWHQKPIFTPVHRWFLLQLEAAMGVAMPYWDWVNQPFPAGLGGSGDPNAGYRVTSGPFASWSSVIYNPSTGTFSQRPGIIRRFATATPTLPTAAQQASVLSQTVYDVSPWTWRSNSGLRNWLEGATGNPGPAMHNRVHEWVGGDMRTSTSPNDPIFWFHHCNVDRIWAGWQTRRGVSNYAGPVGQGPNDPMPLTGGVTPSQMFPIPSYDQLP
jgi:tyrosinase